MHRARHTSPNRQHGEINLPRLFTICAILVVILTLPLHFLNGKGKALKSRAAAASAPVATPAADKP